MDTDPLQRTIIEEESLQIENEIDVTKEYDDYEPTNAAYTGNHAGTDASASSWPRGRHDDASPAAGNGAESFRRTSRTIANALDDIASGRPSGEYPAIDAIIGRQRTNAAAAAQPSPQRHQSPRQGAHEGFVKSSRRRLIMDIRPGVKERLAVVEHELGDLEYDMVQVRQDFGGMASADELRDVERELTRRLDREVMPAIQKVNSSATIKLVITLIALFLSMSWNIISLYRLVILKL